MLNKNQLLVCFLIAIVAVLVGTVLGRSMVVSDIKNCAAKDATLDNSGFVTCVNRLGS